jgi:cytochrome c biogenesis protein CcdA/thiol-disulfide isomerase/thioredoxin
VKSDLITIFLGFLEGFALIISPCVLSILPIILASSLTGSKKRPLGIIFGFACTFALFGYFAHNLVQYTGIDLNFIRHLAYGFLLLFALIMMSSHLSEQFSRLTQAFTAIGTKYSSKRAGGDGFWGGVLLGGLVSIIWTPCAGPILASVIAQIVIQQKNIISFFILLAFALGAAIPMLILTLYGLKVKNTFSFFKKYALLFRRILGLIIIINIGYMICVERGYLSSSITISQTPVRTENYLKNALWHFYQAPKIEGIEAWINSPPLQIDELKGKVVLIDFWTYSCINCVRTLPYLKDWYKKYHDKGLVIIGIHTPEFDFEKNKLNVEQAVKQNGIEYPVALDNQFTTWNNFSNHYWPAQYLINQEGKVVYQHLGEGDDDVIENNIRFLLNIGVPAKKTDLGPLNNPYFITPETYLGYARANEHLSPSLVHDKTALYQAPQQLSSNAWGLKGSWQVSADKITSTQANAAVEIHFNARKVFVVMGKNTDVPTKVNVLLNSKPLLTNQGKDVSKGSIMVNQDSIYEVLNLPKLSSGVLQISPDQPGLEIYTFTFGS